MIDVFESTTQARPHTVFFTFVNAQGAEETFTYRETRLISAALASRLRQQGVVPGTLVSVDLPNSPLWVFLFLAAAYGGFGIVALNHRLSANEKQRRIQELKRNREALVFSIDEEVAAHLYRDAKNFLQGEGVVLGRANAQASGRVNAQASGRVNAQASGRATAQMGASRNQPMRPPSFTGRVDDSLGGHVETAVHFAERAAHTFDPTQRALIMFTSGTTGVPKAASLTWGNLIGAAKASNTAIRGEGMRGLWQAVLPFFHVGGLQVLVRAVLARWSLRVYERFDATQVLNDAATCAVTHISVVDKMLQDMLDVAEKSAAETNIAETRTSSIASSSFANSTNAEPASPLTLSCYKSILLGGGPLNERTLERALLAKASVYASYGMTETAGCLACEHLELAHVNEPVGLHLLPGYRARIVDADEQGFGTLALKGPGVFLGYLNAHAAQTIDGYFCTGDRAALRDGLLYIHERTEDLFISGGENIYPAEIAATIRSIVGVADAQVVGLPDAHWGKRPVAVVEPHAHLEPSADFAEYVFDMLEGKLSPINMPQRIQVVESLPRTVLGKVDRQECLRLFTNTFTVENISISRVNLPFKRPFKTPHKTLTHRTVLIIEITDSQGNKGYGECSALESDWYLPETLAQDAQVLQTKFVPLLQGQTFRHPREVSILFRNYGLLDTFPLAAASLEMACWDVWGKVVEKPLWYLLGEEFDRLSDMRAADGKTPAIGRAIHDEPSPSQTCVYSGAVVGLSNSALVLAEVKSCVEAGYQRIKLKIAPGGSVPAVQAVRRAFPDVLITLDANQSFTMHHLSELRAFDKLNVGWIEEPLNMKALGLHTGEQAIARLASFQRSLSSPLCVDESFVNAREAQHFFDHPELRFAAIKVGKFGGIQPALEFVHRAVCEGREVCLSGMYDTGVSRYVHAAFQTLPGVVMPGDLGATSRYFNESITVPPYTAPHGVITLNTPGHEYGIGCEVDRSFTTFNQIFT